MQPTTPKNKQASLGSFLGGLNMDKIGKSVYDSVNFIGGGLGSIGKGIGNAFNHSSPQAQPQAQTAPQIPSMPIGAQYQSYLQKVKNGIDGSFKKGGPVKKTGNYKLHKGEFVVNPRLAALIKTGEGPERKGYEQTYKTVPKKKYNRDTSQAYREKTGFYKTKINGMGHTAGFKWAESKDIDPKERRRKYGNNSPSFDEGVHEFKRYLKEQALKSKSK